MKVLGSEQDNCGPKTQVEASSGSGTKPTEPLKDYIHVRARRGQATDSHSLAERVLYFFFFFFFNLNESQFIGFGFHLYA